MRLFVAGLLIGAALYAAGDTYFEPNALPPPTSQAPVSTQPAPTEMTRLANAATSASSAPASETRSPMTSDQADSSGDCIRVDDSNLHRVIDELVKRSSQREQEELDAEPKDPLWAASMEQQLSEFARHPMGNRFSLTTVDCRTLYCQIRAEAPASQSLDNENPRRAFTKVIEDIVEQLGMARGAGGSGPKGTVLEMHERLRRFKPGMECPPGFQKDCWNR